MNEIEAGNLLSEIGGMVVREASLEDASALLYAEVEDGVVSTAIFRERSDFVEYLYSSHDLAMRVLDFWYKAVEGKKWAALLLTTDGKKFDVRFQYPEDWGDDDEVERREKMLLEKFGNKKVQYPSIQDFV
ncbi:hypothetical protein [Sphingomonas sp. PB4P5]|uniref:hypothetical protein n=1 Tax=Parasphingomonas puruogangriensis TaxID=3096155 RepID=UPI002FCB6999